MKITFGRIAPVGQVSMHIPQDSQGVSVSELPMLVMVAPCEPAVKLSNATVSPSSESGLVNRSLSLILADIPLVRAMVLSIAEGT